MDSVYGCECDVLMNLCLMLVPTFVISILLLIESVDSLLSVSLFQIPKLISVLIHPLVQEFHISLLGEPYTLWCGPFGILG